MSDKEFPFLFLARLIRHKGKSCVAWPYGKDRHGYGQVWFRKKVRRAHRVMCELVLGPPPTPNHYASHNCGKGHLGCVNPNHLEWKTASENQYDRRRHGTHGGGRGRGVTNLTHDQVREIRASKGVISQRMLSIKYGLAEGTIRGIQARRWFKSVS